MNASEDTLGRFEELGDCIGKTIRTLRIGLGQTQREMSQLLRLVFRMVEAKTEWLTLVEEGKFRLCFEQFDVICQALQLTPEEVLERAWEFKKQNAFQK